MEQLLEAPPRRDGFHAFVARHVAARAEQWDRDQQLPASAISLLAEAGYLGWTIPEEHGGAGRDIESFGRLHEAMGSGSSALTGVLTVQAMVAMTLLKWGSVEQRRRWLPRLARGDTIGSFAMTEPGGGSALDAISTELTPRGRDFVLSGAKKWISCAQFAGLFLVFAKLEGRPVACLVERERRGLSVEPITDLMGFRAAGLAEVRFEQVHVAAGDLVGRPGFALSHVAPVGLHFGRISTACSALGLLGACCEASAAHARTRRIGGGTLGDLGTARAMIARMATDLEAARLLCRSACRAADEHRPDAYERVMMAKYFASRAAVAAASDAVQLHGAAGCHASSPVSRYYRDAKIMEIIEGTTQVHEDILGRIVVDRAGSADTGTAG